MKNPIRLVIADDHPVVRGGLQRFLDDTDGISVCATAASWDELMQTLNEHEPDVLVLDLDMPGFGDTGRHAKLRDVASRVRTVVFTMHPEDAQAVEVLRAGALGYLNKGRDPEELVTAIRAASRGRRHLTEMVADHLIAADGTTSRPVHETFSQREREIFDRLVAGKAPKDIARELDVQPSTVHTYCERIRTKLGVETTAQIVAYAFRHGLSSP